jgi:hypothetical protein
MPRHLLEPTAQRCVRPQSLFTTLRTDADVLGLALTVSRVTSLRDSTRGVRFVVAQWVDTQFRRRNSFRCIHGSNSVGACADQKWAESRPSSRRTGPSAPGFAYGTHPAIRRGPAAAPHTPADRIRPDRRVGRTLLPNAAALVSERLRAVARWTTSAPEPRSVAVIVSARAITAGLPVTSRCPIVTAVPQPRPRS